MGHMKDTALHFLQKLPQVVVIKRQSSLRARGEGDRKRTKTQMNRTREEYRMGIIFDVLEKSCEEPISLL